MSIISKEQVNQALAKISQNMSNRPCPFCGSMEGYIFNQNASDIFCNRRFGDCYITWIYRFHTGYYRILQALRLYCTILINSTWYHKESLVLISSLCNSNLFCLFDMEFVLLAACDLFSIIAGCFLLPPSFKGRLRYSSNRF